MRTFELRDHKCPDLEKLLEEKKVSYKWAVCDCSPCERSYQILEEGEWKDIFNCPFCGVPMTELIYTGLITPEYVPIASDRAVVPDLSGVIPVESYIGVLMTSTPVFKDVDWSKVSSKTAMIVSCPKCGSKSIRLCDIHPIPPIWRQGYKCNDCNHEFEVKECKEGC